MGKGSHIARPPYVPERRHRRFALEYPVQMHFSRGSSISEMQGTSKNVSLGGLLVNAASPVPNDSAVIFTMTVQGGALVHPVKLVGEGKVVRVERKESESGFAIAVECSRPLAEMADYLAASSA
jgi:PilZ domain